MPDILAQLQQGLELQTQLENNKNTLGALWNSVHVMQNPKLLSEFIRSTTAPLNEGLVSNVTENSQASAAEAGLGNSPMLPFITAQALGSAEQQNQALGTQLGLAGLSSPTMLPFQYPTMSAGGGFYG